ncbi:MAG: hypothetical protein AAF740_09255, partial [Bacteroidota bacterium]
MPVLLLFLLFLPKVAFSQENCRTYPYTDTLRLDSLTVLPNSIRLPEYPEVKIFFDQDLQALVFETPLTVNELEVCFETLPFRLDAPLSNRSQAAYDSGFYNPPDSTGSYESESYTQREEIFQSSTIRKAGSLSRGISFGNRQDVFVNSNLNLQLEGEVTPGLELSAIISDQNVPFQPEGNTQQLQEFDRVQVRLKHKRFQLTAGDVLFEERQDHFLRFYKNVTGALLEVNYADSSNSALGISLAKGQFTSSFLEVQEGVQGPYRLRGPNNENFIIIIAGSEKVYLDGKPLERGFSQDYTIDYNAAEITFTSNVLITQFSRVWVEFEFTAQNYSRTLWQAAHEQRLGKWTVRAHHYQERDNRRNSLFRDLSEREQNLLIGAGDMPVLSPTEEVVEEFSADRVLYRRRDTTLFSGQTISFFDRATVQTTDSLFSVTFSEVGTGNGDYRLQNATTNGRVFEWVGVGLGNYAPIAVLPPPNQRQMSILYAEYAPKAHERFFVEAAFTDRDLNLFSSEDDRNNQSYALWAGYENKGRVREEWLGMKSVRLESGASLEFDRQGFEPIDRFRPVEFDRDWSADLSEPADDWIATTNVGLVGQNESKLQYQLNFRQRGAAVNGFQHQASGQKKFGKWLLVGDYFRMNNERETTTSLWDRWNLGTTWQGEKVQVGYQWSGDQNRVFTTETDSVTTTAQFFEAHEVFVQQGDSSKAQYRLSYQFRTDELPRFGEIRSASEAQTVTLSGNLNRPVNAISGQVTYRDFRATDSLLSDETILQGQVNWRGNWLDKNVRSELTFSTATGQEPRREFVFIPVEIGLGTHTWRDDNEDSIQDLNEFYEAINPDERQYIKIFRPTQEFQSAFSSSVAYRLQVRAPRKWSEKGGFLKALGKFSGLFAWQSAVRATDSRWQNRFLGLFQGGEDRNLLSREETLRGTLFFNRSSVRTSARLGYRRSARKDLLANGFEQKSQNEWQALLRQQLLRTLTLQITANQTTKALGSDFLMNRNYRIEQYGVKPEVSWQPSQQFRLETRYRFEQKNNRLTTESNEQAPVHEATINVRHNATNARNL